jgi:hypothetical protein
MLRRLNLKDESAVVALEFLAVVGAWMLTLAFLLDMCLVMGNGVALQSALNRAALQASAQGCVSPESAAKVSSLNRLFAENINVYSSWVPSGAATNQQSLAFNRTAALSNIDSGQSSANCPESVNTGGGDIVPQSDYILLEVKYRQKLFLFPSIDVQKTALAISSSFNLEGSKP